MAEPGRRQKQSEDQRGPEVVAIIADAEELILWASHRHAHDQRMLIGSDEAAIVRRIPIKRNDPSQGLESRIDDAASAEASGYYGDAHTPMELRREATDSQRDTIRILERVIQIIEALAGQFPSEVEDAIIASNLYLRADQDPRQREYSLLTRQLWRRCGGEPFGQDQLINALRELRFPYRAFRIWSLPDAIVRLMPDSIPADRA